MKAKGCLSILALLAVASIVFTGVKFYGGKYLDRYQRPWAYSTTEPLLVGKWRGKFNDPDGVNKTIEVQIDIPETDEERLERASRRRRRRTSNNRAFGGIAVVTSRLGREDYEVHGSVDRDEDHQFSLEFTTVDGKFSITPNFYVNDTAPGNRWSGDQMNLTLRFAWHRPDGSTFSNSADPRFDRVAAITLTRITP